MMEVDFGVVEQVRERDHGRRMRREQRRPSDEAVTLARLNGDELKGWALDRSDGGARVLLVSVSEMVPGEVVMLTVGEEALMARIVWAIHEDDTGLFGLEIVVVSGEVSVVYDLEDVA